MSEAAMDTDLASAPLDGVLLLEASAGTGKTHALMKLYLRLLLEQGLMVEQILLVTYTNAAAAELRERLRLALRDALTAAEGQARQRLELALASLDLAAVHTIHGFCQRVLSEHGFESGQPAEVQLLGDETALLEQVAADLWRRHWYEASPPLAAWAGRRWKGPRAVARWLPSLLQTQPPDLPPPPPDEAAIASLAQGYAAAFAQWRAAWCETDAAVLRALLGKASGLSGTKYKPKSVLAWLGDLHTLAQHSSTPPVLEKDVLHALYKLDPETLAAGMNNGKGPPPQHPVFDACGALRVAWQPLQDALDHAVESWPVRIRPEAGRMLESLKAARRVAGFHDLLTRVHAALHGPQGNALAAALAQRWRAALIDEFQDTDTLQYAIFERLFRRPGALLCFSGDPKQAVYGFRGADIHAYLRASAAATARRALTVNWRSTPQLLTALNTLLMRRQPPFFLPGIGYEPVRAAPGWAQRSRLHIGTGAPTALTVWLADEADSPRHKEAAEQRCAEATAADIAELLAQGAVGAARIGARPLCGADIAVLVRTGQQALRVRAALAAQGIASALQAQDSVLDSREAVSVERLLRACAAPRDARALRTLLGDALFGLDAVALLALEQDAVAWERWQSRITRWSRRWCEQGLHAVMLEVLRDNAPRLLAARGGERALTNLLHLAELADEQAHAQGLGPAALCAWFAAWRADHGKSDAAQLRLESDARLVRVVTLHKAKGLQYPVVYLPFLWAGRTRRASAEPHLERTADGVRLHTRLDPDDAVLWARLEAADYAEELRLAYVGLTRAQYRCVLIWGALPGAERAALAWWLHPSAAADLVAHRDHVAALSAQQRQADVRGWALAAPGAVECLPLPRGGTDATRPVTPPAAAELVLRVRHCPGLPAPRVVTSFTALSQAADWHDGRDRDQHAEAAAPADPAAQFGDFLGFPRGARAGVCLHELLERGDFARFAAGDAAAEVRASLLTHGFDTRWTAAVSDMLRRLCTTEMLPDGPRLAALAPAAQAREWEFHLAARALDSAGLHALAREQELDAVAVPAHAQAQAAVTPAPSGVAITGLLHGYVDLIFEHAGRHYLLDYKSNWLGNTAQDYTAPRLAAAMREAGYTLQYLLYSLALHRHLQRCLPAYDYTRDFGGVLYVFLRGVAAGAPGGGVFHARPATAVIERLTQCVYGAEHAAA